MLYSVVCEDIIHCTFPRKVHCFFDCWKDGTVRIRENLPDSIFLFYGGGRRAVRVAEVLWHIRYRKQAVRAPKVLPLIAAGLYGLRLRNE